MKRIFGVLKLTLGVAVVATLFAHLAGAQCVSTGTLKHNTSLLRQPFLTNPFAPVSFSSVAYGGIEEMPNLNGDPVVGFWRVNLISEGNESLGIPDGTVLDAGFSHWHSDGAEILNSSRQPATQSFCMGMWEKVGPSNYALNHFALTWTSDGDFVGPANIRENVTLSPDHNSLTGTFTLDEYSTGGVWPATPSQLTLAAHITGNVQAKRITMSTTIDGVL